MDLMVLSFPSVFVCLYQVQYILCIRPNMENNPVLFEDEYVTQQLLSASIVEAAQVRGGLLLH